VFGPVAEGPSTASRRRAALRRGRGPDHRHIPATARHVSPQPIAHDLTTLGACLTNPVHGGRCPRGASQGGCLGVGLVSAGDQRRRGEGPSRRRAAGRGFVRRARAIVEGLKSVIVAGGPAVPRLRRSSPARRCAATVSVSPRSSVSARPSISARPSAPGRPSVSARPSLSGRPSRGQPSVSAWLSAVAQTWPRPQRPPVADAYSGRGDLTPVESGASPQAAAPDRGRPVFAVDRREWSLSPIT
jgi:hypothetical protein